MVTPVFGEAIAVIMKGVLIIIPLLAASLIAVAVIVERLYFWRRLGAQEVDSTILALVAEGDLQQALQVARTSRHPSPLLTIRTITPWD